MANTVKTTVVKYTLFGILFGLAFPLFAIGLEFYRNSASLTEIFVDGDHAPLLWIIMLAPFVLGTTFNIIGRKHAGLQRNLIRARLAENRNRELANLDQLTQHGNRRGFIKAVRAQGSEAPSTQSAYLFLIDLDNFKFVNDTLGHKAGDTLLVTLSARLSSAISDKGILFRLGGDEFAAIVECDPDGINALANRMLKTFEDPVEVEDTRVVAGGSIGVSRLCKDENFENSSLLQADLALRKAKEIFGNAYCLFEEAMAAEAAAKLSLEKDLQAALNSTDQLHIVFQPIINAVSLQPDGFEALARWQHPRLGEIPPNDFIPAAEASGLILPLGKLIMRKACKAAAQWELPLSLSINVSGAQFKDRRFFDEVESALEAAGLDPERLILEITESVFIHDIGLVSDTFRRLKKIGVRFALDDFGTGFSSINHLRNLELDTLKLDRSFVERAVDNEDEGEIVRKIIELGRAFDLTITAEGVATRQQLELMSNFGVEHLQGFYFERPVTPEEAGRIVRSFKFDTASHYAKAI